MKLNFIKKGNEIVPLFENGEPVEDVIKCTVSSSDEGTVMTVTVRVTDRPDGLNVMILGGKKP